MNAELLKNPLTEEEAIEAVAEFKREFPMITKVLENLKKKEKEKN